MSEGQGTKRYWAMGFAALAIILVFSLSGTLFVNVSASEIVIARNLISGEITVWTTAGFRIVSPSDFETFSKSYQFWFSNQEDQGSTKDQSMSIRFNDAASADLSGSCRFDLPLARDPMISLYEKYQNASGIKSDLVRTVIERSVYMTGPLMSSRESFAEKRPELVRYILDQALYGVYKTISEELTTVDPITGARRTFAQVRIVEDVTEPGGFARQEPSVLEEFAIRLYNMNINSITYDAEVEDQIKQQRNAIIQVQIAAAESKAAEQRALTIEQEGIAAATATKWEQEAIKAKAVTLAQQKKEVAALARDAARFEKERLTLLGQGEANRKRAVLAADGALAQKLSALVEINKNYATAIQNYQGDWVSRVSMDRGGSGQAAGSGALDLLEVFLARSLEQLSVDITIPAGTTVK